MNLLSNGIVNWCRKNGAVSDKNYPIVLYGIQILLNTSLKVIGILLIGILLKCLTSVFISMAVFCSMRYWTGGWHSKSNIGCFSYMIIPCVCPALLMKIEAEWASYILGGMLGYTIYAVIKYSPCNSTVNPIVEPEILKFKRWGSLLELFILIISVILWKSISIRFLVIIPLFIDAFLLEKQVRSL